MWAREVAERLRATRKECKLGQQDIADALEMSVSEVSRLERGVRGLRVDQLEPWAEALGKRIELLMFDGDSPELDEEALEVLIAVAEAVGRLPGPARRALIEQMKIWRASG